MIKYLIIGPSGVGKSTVLDKLSKNASYDTYDLDALISENVNKDLTRYVAEVGWEGFFNKSKDIIDNLISERDIVVAVGAGSFEYLGGHSWFHEQNTIALTGDPKYIYERSNRQMFHPKYDGYYATEFAPARQNLYNGSKYIIDVTNHNADVVFKMILNVLDDTN